VADGRRTGSQSWPPLAFAVQGLPLHLSPSRLLDEFPTALAVEAHYCRQSGKRTALIVTFDSPPPARSAAVAILGSVLQPIACPPRASDATTRRMVWRRGSRGAPRSSTSRDSTPSP